MRRIFAALIALVVSATLAGCMSKSVWVKPRTTQAQFNQDMAACKYDAEKAAAPSLAQNGFVNGYQTATFTHDCMEAKGYVWESLSAAEAERAAHEK